MVPELQGCLEGKAPTEEGKQPFYEVEFSLYAHIFQLACSPRKGLSQQSLKTSAYLRHDLVLQS